MKRMGLSQPLHLELNENHKSDHELHRTTKTCMKTLTWKQMEKSWSSHLSQEHHHNLLQL